MRALVTGSGGFVGRFLVDHLLNSGDTVLATDSTAQAPRSSMATGILDVTNFAQCRDVILEFKPGAVYHLAGIAFVPDAERDFDLTLKINVGGVANIYKACNELGTNVAIVLVSSAEVYGKIEANDLPIVEERAIRPVNSYGLSKAMAELIPPRYNHSAISSVIARPFNHIGPGQRVEFVVSSFAQQLARITKGLAAPVLRVGNLGARRDFCDVRDVVRAYRLGAQHGNGTYNLCSGVGVEIRAILDMLIEISGADVSIESDPSRMRPSEIPANYGSYARAQAQLGWRPTISLRDSLRDVFNWWVERS